MSDLDDQSPQSLFATGSKRGRPRGRIGNRAKLGQRFFEDLYAAWEEQGESVIARAFFHDPVASLRVVATLMPQKLEITTPVDGMTDERLAQMLELADRMAELRASGATVMQPARLSYEYPKIEQSQVDGGRGAVAQVVAGKENTPYSLRAGPGKSTETTDNMLSTPAQTPENHSVFSPEAAGGHHLGEEDDTAVDPASLF